MIQYDDRIIECCWSMERGTWQFMRIRDDKEHANHKSIMEKILVSIQDGVEIEAVRISAHVRGISIMLLC
jgi:mRNA guanylyltransferase